MAEKRESLSAQSARRTNWILMVGGLILVLLFLMVLCSRGGDNNVAVAEKQFDYGTDDKYFDNTSDPAFSLGEPDRPADLVADPANVVMDKVSLGSTAEVVVTLQAKNGAIEFEGTPELTKPDQEDGFELSGSCFSMARLDENQTCLIVIHWSPTTLVTYQNKIRINWFQKDHSYKWQELRIGITGRSADADKCIVCPGSGTKEPVPLIGVDPRGKVGPAEDPIETDGSRVKMVGDPNKVPLGLNNRVLGVVQKGSTDVLDVNGQKLGVLLGDDTIVDANFNVIGAAVPVSAVLDEQGKVIGVSKLEGNVLKVVDEKGMTIGTPRVDSSVVDYDGRKIGVLAAWGGVIDLDGNFLGVVLPDGRVLTESETGEQMTIGHLQQNGLVVDDNGELIGGVIPKGVGVSTGCRTYGPVLPNGEVKDAYGQLVGRVFLDGSILDGELNEIGAVIPQGLVVNEKGQLQGYVSKKGQVLDKGGSLIGCADPSGVVRAGKSVVGGVMKRGMVVGRSCEVIGSVYPNGVVMNQAVEPVGYVRPDGYVADSSRNVIGAVVPFGTAIAEGCRLLGMISLTGQIIDSSGVSVGCVTADQKVINKDGVEFGEVTPHGPVMQDGVFVGRIRLDGRIINRERKVIGCITDINEAKMPSGIVLDASGMPTEWSTMGGKCYSETNELIGDVAFNGWVSNKQGRIIGFVPPEGVIVSNTGSILGNYSPAIGFALDKNGEKFARVLPDLTALDMAGNTILGSLIPLGAVGIAPDATVLGKMSSVGFLGQDNNVFGRVYADGRVIDSNGKVAGHIVGSGPVLSALGRQVGWVGDNGEVLSRGTRIGTALGNGLAIGTDKQILGRVWMPMSVLTNGAGILGTAVPKTVTRESEQVYQVNAYDRNGNYIGIVSPFGVVLGNGGRLIGRAVPITLAFDFDRNLMGWMSFSGEVIDKTGRVLGVPTENGLIVNQEGVAIGFLNQKGIATTNSGKLLGLVAPNGKVITDSGDEVGFIGPSDFVLNNSVDIVGKRWPLGVALDGAGHVLGWMDDFGAIVGSSGYKGIVSFDGRMWDMSNNVVGGFVPLGAGALSESGEGLGIVNEKGLIVSTQGAAVGSVMAPTHVVKGGKIIGRLLTDSFFAGALAGLSSLGQAEYNSDVYRFGTSRAVGRVTTNGFVADSSDVVVGSLIPAGLAQSANLKSIGAVIPDGSVLSGKKVYGSANGLGVIFANHTVVGGVVPQSGIVDRNGLWIGMPNGFGKVMDKSGTVLGSQMTFGSVLSTENVWVGGPIKTGVVVDDYAAKIGSVGPDGSVLQDNGAFKGRVLSDGSVAGVPENNVYNSMPYTGHVVAQGLPMSYDGSVLGRTTINGEILDAAGKKVYSILDDGSVQGVKTPLVGAVVPFGVAAGFENVLGTLTGDGKVIDFSGVEVGFVDASGLVGLPRGTTQILSEQAKLDVLGAMIPDRLVVDNECHVVGQTSYTGAVINGQGNTVGRLQPSGWAEDTTGRRVGHIATVGPVLSVIPAEQEGGVATVEYLGRTLPDGSVVNEAGVPMGCAQNDDTVIDSAGQVIGKVITRGPVWGIDDKQGIMIGRVDSRGKVVDEGNVVIGFVDGNLRAFNYEGKEIGFATRQDSMTVLDVDGYLAYSMTKEGTIYNGAGKFLYNKNHRTKEMTGKYGEQLGLWSIDGTFVFLYDNNDKILARLVGCELFTPGGETLLGKVSADGSIKDINEEIYGTAMANNLVYNPDGSVKGEFRGIGLDLRKCGLSGFTGKSGSRTGIKFKLGGQDVELGENNVVIDPKRNRAIGYLGTDGRLVPFDPRVSTDSDDDRVAPTPQPPKPVPKEWTKRDVIYKRRQQMASHFSSGVPSTIPGPEILAKAKKHQDKKWAGVGKNVSSWPVDMSNMILRDKAIPAVLVHSIDQRYDVPVTAIVERNIYAESGRNIIIPAGSHLIGSFSGVSGGEARAQKIEISWDRLIRPDGAAFKFSGQSGDAQGRGGVPAYLDQQLFKKYANPFVTSIGYALINKMVDWNEKSVSSSSSSTGVTGTGQTYGQQTRQMFIDNFQEIFDAMMEEANRVQPVLFIPSGTRLVVYPSEDLWLRSVADDEEEMVNSGMTTPKVENANVNSWVDVRQNTNSGDGTYDGGTTAPVSGTSGTANPNPQDTIYEEEDALPDELLDRTIDPVVEKQNTRSASSNFM